MLKITRKAQQLNRKYLKPFLKKHPMAYPVGLGAAALTQQYKLEELPVTLVFDRAGKQVKRFEGFTEEAALLEAVRQAR